MFRTRLYYAVKPYLPWHFRMALRRLTAKPLLTECRTTWPIHQDAAAAPAGWAGWPGAKRFAFVLTHDVEGAAGVAKSRDLIELEQELGYRSSFNFIPEGAYRVPAELRETIQQLGFEVGVHDLKHDGKLFQSRDVFSRRAAAINRYLHEWNACGFRSGFMFRNLEWLHDLDIAYDSSTFDTDPFEPQPEGIRTIFPFWVEGSPDHPARPGYVELPYTLPQDSTLFLVLQEKSPAIWLQKLDWIAEHGGMALLNVHPDYIRRDQEPKSARTYPLSHYRALLEHLRQHYAGQFWHPLAKDMAAHVRTLQTSTTTTLPV